MNKKINIVQSPITNQSPNTIKSTTVKHYTLSPKFKKKNSPTMKHHKSYNHVKTSKFKYKYKKIIPIQVSNNHLMIPPSKGS